MTWHAWAAVLPPRLRNARPRPSRGQPRDHGRYPPRNETLGNPLRRHSPQGVDIDCINSDVNIASSMLTSMLMQGRLSPGAVPRSPRRKAEADRRRTPTEGASRPNAQTDPTRRPTRRAGRSTGLCGTAGAWRTQLLPAAVSAATSGDGSGATRRTTSTEAASASASASASAPRDAGRSAPGADRRRHRTPTLRRHRDAHEKGGVEHGGGRFRRSHLFPARSPHPGRTQRAPGGGRRKRGPAAHPSREHRRRLRLGLRRNVAAARAIVGRRLRVPKSR